jgi:hypothetical protein
LERARLVPVSGISNDIEAEQRATSAFLAVLSIVRDLSIDLLSPLGASRAQRALVETFTEVRYKLEGKVVQPDGLIRVSFANTTWSALVEVKTSDNVLSAEQVNMYWELARDQHLNHVLTISNEIGPMPGIHPTPGLKVKSNSSVQVSHLSWPAILTTAIRIKEHRGVTDPEQAWILSELVRYLEHPASGALAFGDMGPNWVEVRDGVRARTLNRRDDSVTDVAARFDQLLRFGALKLGSEIGHDVTTVLALSQRDPKARLGYLADRLAKDGVLNGTLRIPNTAGDVTITADLRSQQVIIALEVDAPDDRGGKARATWLVSQIKDAPGNVQVQAYAKGARLPTTVTLATLRDDRAAVLNEQGRDPVRFHLIARTSMGQGRKAGGRSPGFIDTVLDLLTTFYETVVQPISPWQRKAPKLKREPALEVSVEATDAIPPSPAVDGSPAEGSESEGLTDSQAAEPKAQG